MTNQKNPSVLEVAQKEAFDLGVRTRKRKLKKTKKCLYNEQKWTEKLTTALDDAGLELPDRNKEIRQKLGKRFKFVFKRHLPVFLAVFIATLGIALFLISFWPHYHIHQSGDWCLHQSGDWCLHLHPRNPFKVLAN